MLPFKRAEMSEAIYDDVIRIESERVEMTVDIYERADCVRDHDFRTETNTQQPLQHAGNHSDFFDKIVFMVYTCSVS